MIEESKSNESVVKISKGNTMMYRTELKDVRVDLEISKDEMKTAKKVRGPRSFEVLSAGVLLLAAIEYAYDIVQIGKDIAVDPKTAIDQLIQGEVDLTEVPKMIERMDSNITRIADRLGLGQKNEGKMENVRILMVGLDAAGKTTTLFKLKQEIVMTVPTFGEFSVDLYFLCMNSPPN